MICIYPEQLTYQLADKLRTCYLIIGNEPLFLQESMDKICQVAKQQGFYERYTYSLDINTEWDYIYHISKSLSLFTSRQIIILILPESGPTTVIAENLLKLAKLLHPDLLLILCGSKLTKVQKNSAWYKKIGKDGVHINCLTPERSKLPQWVTQRAIDMSVTLDKQANKLLCYCYEGNLLALNQELERLSLLYPDGNFTLPRVKEAINNDVNITPYHWVNALLVGKIKRAWHLLKQLQREDYEAVILLRIIQRELILLLTIQNSDRDFKNMFDQHKICPAHRSLISSALQRLSLSELQLAIQLITHAELNLKQDYGYSIWLKLETLSMILCGKFPPKSFINNSTN
ncbi:DNA polymerase III subunit delta [Arsenophonus endosymbiont of Aleurodicus dispersus]|uniref:DNA polymerase III subunit delta n=1 Tax=Arsenophonus endosymbiont of Aleurodicus dispersus TaxID=235559 RepID=UPI000EB13F2B|nr:DNA polymerase III subunit delta [Arsenophonus endosymbiont of Aleurodicus dispersus]VAY02221.1 DNA polymerase III subunit delta [Arsenophonus endosymbiont of Aleurodicus dispersus]